MLHSNRRMRNAVKRISLHGGVVYHIFKDDLFANLEFVVKLPIAKDLRFEI